MEELERIEVEKAAKVDISGFEMLLVYFSSSIGELLIFIVDWSTILPMSSFSFGLFTDLRISNIVETLSDIQLGS